MLGAMLAESGIDLVSLDPAVCNPLYHGAAVAAETIRRATHGVDLIIGRLDAMRFDDLAAQGHVLSAR
jgi:outer membrane receptor for monomeric catechols